MMRGSGSSTKRVLLVAASLFLTYIIAFFTLMIGWMNYWIRGPYFFRIRPFS
jgi:hypothetical protein